MPLSVSAVVRIARLGFEDHAILVRLREDRRDDALAERVVERVVDRRGRDAEARGRGAVDLHVDRLAVRLQVGRDVGEFGRVLQALDELRHPLGEFRRVRVVSMNWYCVGLTVESIVRSCTGCM